MTTKSETKKDANLKDYAFLSTSLLTAVFRGFLVGIIVGLVVGSFRWLIEQGLGFVRSLYQLAHQQPIWLFFMFAIYSVIALVLAFLMKREPEIKGSGIPQVEAELKGLLPSSWWAILWRKFIGGVLAIASGLMLGREGPSIQLGAMVGKGIACWSRLSQVEERTLLASGAAAGIATAFNAPIAGLLFVVEEVYHHFSRLVWVSALTACLTANVISLRMFGETPVLQMPTNLPHLPLEDYWHFILLGALLGGLGWVYEKVILFSPQVYTWLGKKLHLSSNLYSIIAFLAILPIGYYLPQLLGGGNSLIISLPHLNIGVGLLLVYFVLRFIFSMISYASGLPGGIFLPILTLGALLGSAYGQFMVNMGIVSQASLPLFLILGMSGYFGAISKAPLTAIVLVCEMVGDLQSLMGLGVVTLTAYVVMDLLKGVPIYEAMLERSYQMERDDNQTTLIQIPVSEKLAGKRIADIKLPADVLIVNQRHQDTSQLVTGQTILRLGETIDVAIKTKDLAKIRELLL